MIKMFINDEEVVSNKELAIKEEMLSTPSTILNNCYPKAWENIKDYVSKFYYPRDYSRCIIAKGFERGEDRWLTYNESGSNINFDTNISLPFKNITIDGKSTQATRSGKNLLPDYFETDRTVNGINYIYNSNGTYNVNGTASGGNGTLFLVDSVVRNDKPIMFSAGTYYTLKSSVSLIGYTGSKYIDLANNTTNSFTLSEDTTFTRIYLQVANGKSVNDVIAYPIISTSPITINDYEKYGVSPSPDFPSEIECVKDTIQVKDVGKNLFDINDVTTSANSNWGISVSGNTLTIEHKNTYTTGTPTLILGTLPSGNYTISGTFGRVISLYRNDTYSVNLNSGNTFASNGTEILSLRFGNPEATALTYTDIQLEKGTVATTYEPYQENTLNINLQGNELCSLPNNAKDELVIENGRAKIIKNVGKYNITGNEAWALTGTESQPYINFSNYADNCKYPAKTTELPNLLSNYYLQITRNNLYDGRITLSPGKDLIIYDTVHNTSLANFKTWLKSAGVVVYYQLATPTEIDLGEVETLSTFEGVNNVSLDTNMQTNMSLTYLYKNYELIFCGIVKNSGNISLNPRYPHFCDLQILDFKNFLSESDMLDFVISNKTVVEAINMVIEAIKDYGFILGNVNIFGADDIIKAYSTQNKTAYDVFQYLADITGSRWYTRTIDEETVAIDFYDPTLMPSGMNIEYNVDWFEENQIVDLQFNYGSRDYRNKQVMMSNEVFGNINYNETLISNGYETSYLLLNNIGEIVSITINGEEKTFVTNELHDIGFEADFYYTPNKNQLESEDTYTIGTQIVVKYIPIIEGRQVVYNYDEIMRINNQTGRKGIIARYETRNDTTSSKELEKIGETYIKYKGTSEINLLLTSEKDLYNIGQIVYFDSPINELTQSYMVKTKEIKIIAVADFQKVLYDYELTSSFNSEKEINYFDNQRSKNKGNIEEGETITRNIDIENSTEILFNNLSISEVTPTGDNILDCILESPFID